MASAKTTAKTAQLAYNKQKDTAMRTKKFESIKFLRYEKHFLQSVQDPLPYALEAANKARAAGVDAAEVDMSPSREVMLNSKAAALWKANEPCINASEVVTALRVANGARWRYDNGIPKVLTAAQAAYALDGWPDSAYNSENKLEVQRTEIPTYGTINPRRPSLHPLQAAMDKTADTLVGVVTGRWRMLRHLTEADGYARQKGLYKAACIVCGAQEDLAYSKAAHRPCRVCLTRQPSSATRHSLRIKTPFTLWQLESGDLVYSGTVPEGAVNRFDITHRMLPTEAKPLTPKEAELTRELATARKMLEAKLQTTDIETAEKEALAELRVAVQNGTDLFGDTVRPVYRAKPGRPKSFRPVALVKKLEMQQEREDKATQRANRKLLAEARKALLKGRNRPEKAEDVLLPPVAPEELEIDSDAREEQAAEVYKDMVQGLELPEF